MLLTAMDVLTEFFNISEPSEIIISSTFENVSCNGNNDGNINQIFLVASQIIQ